MDLNELGKKQANLQQPALDSLVSNLDMEKKDASQAEIEEKANEADRLIEESGRLGAGLKAASLEKTRKIKTQAIIIVVSLLVAVITMQFIK